jgi:hypothetical protein
LHGGRVVRFKYYDSSACCDIMPATNDLHAVTGILLLSGVWKRSQGRTSEAPPEVTKSRKLLFVTFSQIFRIRLSDKISRLHPRRAATKLC